MMTVDNDFLSHYASPYYDPVKAHEYYMRTRELKGNRSTKTLDDEGKEVWSYTKERIRDEKNSKIESEKELKTTKIETYRENAAQTRTRITERLKELNDKLLALAAKNKETINDKKETDVESIQKKTEIQRERIAANRDRAIKRLNEQKIPEGISKEAKAKMVEQRKEKISKLRSGASSELAKTNESAKKSKDVVRDKASTDRSEVTQKTKEERSVNQTSAKAQREEVSRNLKNVIAAAREAYKTAKTSIDNNYEKIYQQEFDKIASEYSK